MSLFPHYIAHILVLIGAQAKAWGKEGAVEPGVLFWVSKEPGPQGGLQWLSATSLEQPIVAIRVALEQRVL